TSAERTIEYLKSQQTDPEPPTPVDPEKHESAFATFMKNNLVGFIVALAVAGAFVGYVIYVNKKNKLAK
ncbi:MAG: hypothetical protein MJ072_04735, partial [Clostridia bacterium]|nr:hypothetical protein [Clostridia bacterium]